ncbi:MAG: BatD family protein [Candidatus Omnitrophica bacterium]|nr:BatD family protein [Candidatus Omnitrophota bacterium]MCM8823893.1 BatD family protein [Candidatus Omnitrophota bacterium]MCM8826300.1 BatD family protein [Candidatus Omnitrophota bacterium]
MKSILIFIFFIFLPYVAIANDISLEVTVDRNVVELGETIRLNFTFHGTDKAPTPKLDKIDNFEVKYLGPSTRISIVNGVVNKSVTHIFTLLPLKVGNFTIGPFSVNMGGKTFTSKPISIEVSATGLGKGRLDDKMDYYSSQNTEELMDRIFLVMSLDKRRIYLNEVVPLSVKLYVNNLAVRDIQFPELEKTTNFSIDKFEQPRQYREELNGIIYDVIEFTTNIFGIRSGEFKLGPAKLKCNLVVKKINRRRKNIFDDDLWGGFFRDDIFEDFFGHYDIYPLELKSTELPVTVLGLPQEGKPNDFEGAVGEFKLEVEAVPLTVKVGDPITLKIKVIGYGNFDTVKLPKIQSTEGFKIYEPQVTYKDNVKIFEQVIIPIYDKVTHIPPINFSFFNPSIGQYETLNSNPIPIKVEKSEDTSAKLIESPKLQVDLVSKKEELGKDIVYIKRTPDKFKKIDDYLYKHFSFWFFNLLSFIIFLFIIFLYRRHLKIIKDVQYQSQLLASKKVKRGLVEINELLRDNNKEGFFDALFKTLRDYLAYKFSVPVGSITVDSIEEIVKSKNFNKNIDNKIKNILSECDMARYTRIYPERKRCEDILRDFKEVIYYLEKKT